MLMTNRNVRLFPHDHVLKHTILRLIPRWILPNHITILRLLMIPFVLFFLWQKNWSVALILFLVAGLTDAVDGSMARTRKQITLWGTVADPIADKLLIGSVVAVFVAEEINVYFAAIIIFMEFLILGGAFIRKRKRGYVTANASGKVKMTLQIIGVSLLLIAKLLGYKLAVPFAVGTLTLAIVFAIVSFLTYGL